MNLLEMESLIPLIHYKDWMLKISSKNDVPYLQWKFMAPNAYTGEPEVQSCRKWTLSEHMTKSEIVGTAFKAALSAEEHECRETFKYHGEAIFGPHINVDELLYVHKKHGMKVLDRRRHKD